MAHGYRLRRLKMHRDAWGRIDPLTWRLAERPCPCELASATHWRRARGPISHVWPQRCASGRVIAHVWPVSDGQLSTR